MLLNSGVGEDSWESLGLQRRSIQSIFKEVSPGCSLEGLMLRLKLQYFGHLMWRADSFEKTLMLGKIEGRRRRGRRDEMVGWHHWLDGHGFGSALGVGDGRGGLACCGSWGHKESDMTEQLNWTEKLILKRSTKCSFSKCYHFINPLSHVRYQHYYSYLLHSNDRTSLWVICLFVQYCFERFSCRKKFF